MSDRVASEGVWGAIARRAEWPGTLAQALVAELEQGLRLLATLPPAVTFFGGARIKPGDPYYEAAERMGEALAVTGIPPRTGAGPGSMTAVPDGYRRALAKPKEDMATSAGAPNTGRPVALTQGFNIKLPFEQAVNPSIEVSAELVHFPTRKLMLYENALGIVIFPGGFGTLDELFEVWRLKCAGRLNDPLVLFGCDFWRPFIDALQHMTLGNGRATVLDHVFGLLSTTDDPHEAIDTIARNEHPRGFDEDPRELGSRIAHELVEGLGYLSSLPEAVTVIGGSRLHDTDRAVAQAEEIARRLAKHGVPTRASGPGPFSVALARGGHQGARFLPQQAFGMRREDARNLYGADRVYLVNDRLTHKVLLTESSLAFVALPGGLGTLDELFSVLCQMQTRKIAPRRVVLVGSAFWKPFWAALRAQMLDGPRRLINPEDLDLAVITDDPAEVAEICLAPPPTLKPRG